MNGRLVWVEGRILAGDEAAIAVDDHGLLIGDGVFETLATLDGVARFLDRHLRRLGTGVRRLSIEPAPDPDVLRRAITDLTAAADITRGRVRVTITPGPGGVGRARGTAPTTIISIEEAALPPESVTLTQVEWVRNERSPLAGIKSTSWSENAQILRSVRALGFDEAVLCDSTGLLSECCAANLFLVVDGRIMTPSWRSGCLPGIIREVLLESGVATECDLDPDQLLLADEIFITSSINEIVAVSRIGDHHLLVDGPGTQQARAALAVGD